MSLRSCTIIKCTEQTLGQWQSDYDDTITILMLVLLFL